MILENKPTIVRKVISEDTSEKVKYALESVVARGTGHNAYIAGYRVGGKTGTAQKAVNGAYLSGNYITSFIGFLPADAPQIVIYIAVDNAKGVTQYGGTVAAPVAKNFLLSAIDVLDIKKRSNEIEREYLYTDKQYATVPNVIGMEVKDAVKELKKFKVEYSGDGNIITYQSPSSGEAIYEGETIRLLLSE